MRMKDTDTMNIGTEMIKVLFFAYPLTFFAICSKIYLNLIVIIKEHKDKIYR